MKNINHKNINRVEKTTPNKKIGIANVKQFLVDINNTYIKDRNKALFITQISDFSKVYETHRPYMLIKQQKTIRTNDRFTKKVITFMNSGNELDAVILLNALIGFWNNENKFDFRNFKNDYTPDDDFIKQWYNIKQETIENELEKIIERVEYKIKDINEIRIIKNLINWKKQRSILLDMLFSRLADKTTRQEIQKEYDDDVLELLEAI